MTKKIFKSMLFVSMIVLFAGSGLIMGILYHYFGKQLAKELKTEAAYLAIAVEKEGMEAFDRLPPQTERVTYIDEDGTVLFDSVADEDNMDNHENRSEIQKALKTGSGTAVRRSDTLSEKTLYYAMKMADGKILRVSSVQYNIPGILGGMVQPILIILIFMVGLSALLAFRLSKKITEPINALDLEHPEDNQVYDELTPLLSKISRQQKSLHREIEDARKQQEEFSLITENMEEGFLVIDKHTEVLSYNSSALKLLGDSKWQGRQSILTLNRSEEFQGIVEQVLEGHHTVRMMEFPERSCQIAANPVWQDKEVTGAVIIILDVTERMRGEQLRREFTANVSHELKTPLTSISGFAEIIKDGFVKPEDTKVFASRIFKEAQRLITLVNDVIKISQLDEGEIVYQKEQVDLYQLSSEVLHRIEHSAKEKDVKLYLEGSHVQVSTVRMILDEVLFNLCENGLKYNKQGGSLTVTLKEENNKVEISVEDTGIGIPEGEQSRVFERFYRVDKSHSKAIGGTGLGLSIVKHGCMYLGAKVDVESTPGVGSKFTITM